MKNITCVILDDESRNIQLLKKMIAEYCPQVQVLGTESDGQKGLVLVKQLQPQMLFLDIEMPHINGFEMLKQLEPVNFEVIFVTAYSHYAVEAFEHHAIGYLTKPVNTEKLLAAVQAAAERIEQRAFSKNLFSLLESSVKPLTAHKIPLSTNNGLVFVKLSDIIYCESSGNYTSFYITGYNKPILVSRQLGEYEKLLPETDFTRIHDKFIINLSYIREYIKGSGGEVVLENGKELPVAARRKEDFLSIFEKWIKRKA
jgi:two-component system LytT family response regulator